MVAVNWLAVAVGTIGYQALGAVWYGPLFGGHWMRAMGFEEPPAAHGSSPVHGYVMTTIGSLVAVAALAVVVDWVGASTWLDGLVVGGLVGVGFVATTALQAVPFEQRPWTVYLLNVGYNVLALAGIGILLAVW